MSDVTTPTVPDAPWALVGECMVALLPARVRRRDGWERRMPPGVAWLPGTALLIALRYSDSPVGPFVELAVAEPARLGLRTGFCVTTSVVSAPPAKVGGRLGWGLPRELGTLTWDREGDVRRVRWEERGIEVRATPSRPRVPLPVLVPLRSLQRRSDGPVVVHGHARGLVRLAHVDVFPPADDPLAAMAGRRRGVLVSGLRLVMRPARRPTGLLSSLRAPLWAPEPALSSPAGSTSGVGYDRELGSRYSASPLRAYSSVG